MSLKKKVERILKLRAKIRELQIKKYWAMVDIYRDHAQDLMPAIVTPDQAGKLMRQHVKEMAPLVRHNWASLYQEFGGAVWCVTNEDKIDDE